MVPHLLPHRLVAHRLVGGWDDANLGEWLLNTITDKTQAPVSRRPDQWTVSRLVRLAVSQSSSLQSLKFAYRCCGFFVVFLGSICRLSFLYFTLLALQILSNETYLIAFIYFQMLNLDRLYEIIMIGNGHDHCNQR